MHEMSSRTTVMTTECREVTVALSLLKTVHVDFRCVMAGDEAEKKVTVINDSQPVK